eukprot:CAMPEP_0184869174 /NCGR_PEP_ID=MMETSP0580-20130426/33198_1 /TAXON_ID=1118495 /ORGANISM="Dactyliosolen fragilissimus" /LENGTH=304 /DNA_ID=CAMNT_0027370493 /DNA_START=717 /DNA_END=1631 /DNA_ORIENTATION=+
MIGSKPTFISIDLKSTNKQLSANGGQSGQKCMRFLIMDAPRPSNIHLYIRECRRHSVTDVVRVCEPTYPTAGLESAGILVHEMPYPDGHSPPREVLDRWLTLVDERFRRGIVPQGVFGGNIGIAGVPGQKSTIPSSLSSTGINMTTNTEYGSDVSGIGAAGNGMGGAAINTSLSSIHLGTTNSNQTSSTINSFGNANQTPRASKMKSMTHGNGPNKIIGTTPPVGAQVTPTIAVHCVAGLGRAPVLVAIAMVEFAMMDPVEAVMIIRKNRRGSINEKQLNFLEHYSRSYKGDKTGAQSACCTIM